MPRSPSILNSQPAIGMQLFDYDSGPASATDFNLVGPGPGGGYNDLLAAGPQITNTHNADFSVNINKHNMLPNPDFIIGGGTVGITGSSTGTVPLYYGAYNPGATEACGFSYNSSAGCPAGNGGAWQLVYSNNVNLKGLYIGNTTGYGGFKLKANTSYIFSVYVSTTWNDVNNYSGQWGLNFDSSDVTYTINNTGATGTQQYYTSDTNWYWINYVLTVGSSPYTGNIYLYNKYNPSGTSQTCYIGCMKLEEGPVASQWTGAVYETGVTDFILPHPNKTVDNIADGSTRAGILITQLSGTIGAYTVNQLNDGTNIFAAATIANGLSSTGQVKVANSTGNLPYTNSSTAIQAVISSGSQLNISPSGGVTGSLPRANTDTSFTTAVDSSGRVIGSIYDGTTTITPANVTNAISNTGLVKVANATGTLPYANLASAITGVISSTGVLNIAPSGGITGTLAYTGLPTAITNVINSSGQILSTMFPNTYENSDGSFSGFSSSGTLSSQTFSIYSGQIVDIEFQFKLASTGINMYFAIGSTTNSYGLSWASSGLLSLFKLVSGTYTSLYNIGTVTQDTNSHALELSISQGSSNIIEASFDKNNGSITDSSLTLTSGTWQFSIQDGNAGTTKFWNFQLHNTIPTYGRSAGAVKTVITSAGALTNNIVTSTAIASGAVGTTQLASGSVTNTILASNSVATGNIQSGAVGTTQLAAASVTNSILASGAVATSNIQASAITSSLIASGAVGTSQLATGAITNAIVAANAITWKSIIGDTSGDTTTSIANTTLKRFLHSSMSTETQQIITSVSGNGQLNVNPTGGVTGNLPYANVSTAVSTAINASGNIIGNIYDGTTTLTPSDITNVITTTGQVKVNNATGTLPYTSVASAVAGVISSGGVLNVNPSGGVTGNIPYANNSTVLTNTINSSGNLLPNPFGSTSGVSINQYDYSLSGFSTSGVSTVEQFPTLVACSVSADISPASTTGTIELGIGSTTNGYSIKWVASGSSGTCGVYRYNAGVSTLIGALGSQTLFTANVYNRLRLVVDFYNQQIEAVIEQEGDALAGVIYPQSDSGGPWSNFGSSVPIWINAGGTSGKVQNLIINPRSCFLQSSEAIIQTIDGKNDAHYLQSGVVDNRSIQLNAVSAGNINGFTGSGAVSYDNIPNGATYGGIKLSALTSGQISQTINTVFGSTVTENSDGSWSGFSSSGTASSFAYTVQAGSVISLSLAFKLAATGAQMFFQLGNSTNGYGLQWLVGGNLQINKWVSGTKTILGTLTTVTQDTNIHSVGLTIVCISSSSVTIEAAFDGQNTVIVNDTAINLTTGTWPITINDGNNGTTKIWNLVVDSTTDTYNSLPVAVKDVITSAGVLTTTAKSSVLNLVDHSGTAATTSIVVCDSVALSFASSATANASVTLTTAYPLAANYQVFCTAEYNATLPSTTLCSIYVNKTSGSAFTIYGVLSAATTSTIAVTINYTCIPV